MLGAFDDVIHHQPAIEQHLLMGAVTGSCIVLVVWTAVDRIVLTAMLETDQILQLNVAFSVSPAR